MADKAITELVQATQVTGTDKFVLEQDGTAKQLTGQTLINYLLKMIDGHGGIVSYAKVSTSGLVDTYRFTFADESTFDLKVTNGRAISEVKQTSVSGLTRMYTISFNDGSSEMFTVTDGRSIDSIMKQSTSGLVDTYKITFNDGSTSTFQVANGAKGDPGDNSYVWIKYASQEPTEGSHSFGDVPDAWMGVYAGNESAAPTDWTLYKWFQIKGEKGATGAASSVVFTSVMYQASDSGTIIPSGEWSYGVPVVSQGKYLWTRMIVRFNAGGHIEAYSVARFGVDGNGSVSSVCNNSPDGNGNVVVSAEDVGALPLSGGDMTGGINMNGQNLSGLNLPTESSQAANKGYVDSNQKPTFTEASSLKNLTSGENLNVMLGKIAKAISTMISHINNKNNPHAVTLEQVGGQAPITVKSKTAQSANLSKGAVGTITSLSVEAGTYLVFANATFPQYSSLEKAEYVHMLGVNTSTSFDHGKATNAGNVAGQNMDLNVATVITLASAGTIYMLGYAAAASTVTNGNLYAIKIG